ncbi:MAG: class I SAM-dependent methyltransferase [Methanomassiliicoccaceae archaeon]|nr:class I SAM-dependent methyltransferase [Methanomassiliicoccaceae archaeon]
MAVPDQKDAWNKLYRSQTRQWKGAVKTKIPLPFKKGDRVIDIGCGNGKTSAALIEEGCDVIGIDISEEAAEACRTIFGSKMRIECASAVSLPFDDGYADGVVMVHVLEHLTADEMEAAVKEVRRVLRLNGKLFVRVFHTDDMRSDKGERTDDRTVIRGNGIRYHYFDETELNDLFGGFRRISTERIDEATKFRERRSRIEAVYEKMG